MADPRAFVSFDFDHDETAKNTVCWASEEFEDPLFNWALFASGGARDGGGR